MAKKLILMRHAHSPMPSNWQQDFARPLSALGVAQATDAGRWMELNSLIPSHIVCSAANRTQQTALALTASFSAMSSKISFSNKIYDASVSRLIEEVEQFKHAQDLLLVAHNPSVSQLASQLNSAAALEMSPASVHVFSWSEGMDFGQPSASLVASYHYEKPS